MPHAPCFGLIGYPLGHSFSPAYFREKFAREGIGAVYEAFELKRIEDLKGLLEGHPGLRGLNVTIPYKEAVIPFLDRLHPDAAAIGAVNCIDIREGRLTGYNTDWSAFAQCLTEAGGIHPGARALVLGTGGSSKAVCYALHRLGVDLQLVSRKPVGVGVLTYEQLDAGLLAKTDLIVNTTPLGMHPATDAAPPLPYSLLRPGVLLFDLIYNPPQTRFMESGRAAGARVENGQRMLILQAEAGWRIWNAASGPDQPTV